MTGRRFAAVMALLLALGAQPALAASPMTLSSPTFQSGQTMPRSMIFTHGVNLTNLCTDDGAPGGNTSPALAWSHVPAGTVSLAVIMIDQTASFTHWGIYNIPPTAGGLPANAGKYGNPDQVVNDFGERGYSGPCPPAGFRPETHTYVITLYALGTKLAINPVGMFPANAETLYRALIDAGRAGKILGSASISGTYNSLPESGI